MELDRRSLFAALAGMPVASAMPAPVEIDWSKLDMRPAGVWSRERLETMVVHWAAGYRAEEIAKIIGGVTRNMVIGKLTRMRAIRLGRELRERSLRWF